MIFVGLTRAQKIEAQRRLNIEKAERKQVLKSPCAVCLTERPWRPRHLLPGQTCETHKYTDPRPFLRPDRSWLKAMRREAKQNPPQVPQGRATNAATRSE